MFHAGVLPQRHLLGRHMHRGIVPGLQADHVQFRVRLRFYFQSLVQGAAAAVAQHDGGLGRFFRVYPHVTDGVWPLGGDVNPDRSTHRACHRHVEGLGNVVPPHDPSAIERGSGQGRQPYHRRQLQSQPRLGLDWFVGTQSRAVHRKLGAAAIERFFQQTGEPR